MQAERQDTKQLKQASNYQSSIQQGQNEDNITNSDGQSRSIQVTNRNREYQAISIYTKLN